MATTISHEIPEFGSGEGPFETLRMGTESAILRSLIMLVDPSVSAPITEEALQGDRDFVRRGVPLDKVMRGIHLGHAGMAHAFMAACETLVPAEQRPAQMRHLSSMLFRFINGFSSHMAEEYLAEHDRWVTSTAAAREATVRAILAGEAVDVEAAARMLDYPLAREHIALSAWFDRPTGTSSAELQRAAVGFLRGCQATATLVVPIGRTGLWAWGSRGAWLDDAVPPAGSLPVRDNIRLACGSVGTGVAGFRQTHEEALLAARLAQANPRPDTQVVRYEDIEVAALLSADLPRARRFLQRELGPLAARTEQAAELRETLRHYLASGRSLKAAAEQTHVARNTVAYRVKRAQQLLGHDIGARRFETETALHLVSVLGPAALTPAEAPESAPAW
ncbi:PucR family transcriptional regulator [Streptomyces cinereospinus]|uniref:PucR family transcriptional regulator n=1 Tax=Streptomyces cinereospinus TaxID=285561 RepID=A0ABV5N5L5_9ACTN